MSKTPNQKWQEEIINYKKKCQRILLISPSIRYAGLINEHGRTLTGVIRQETSPLLKSNQARDEFFLISTLLSMRRANCAAIGDMESAVFKHKKIILVLFQRKEGLYYITVDKETTFEALAKIIAEIKKII
jgi:hypothetical protein